MIACATSVARRHAALDRASLERAYAGADAVVLQFPLVYDERALAMADNAARAAEAAGVEHLVINTSAPLPPAPIGVPFLDARHHAAAAAVQRVTVLQPTLYMENLNAPWSAERVVRDGVLAYPLPGEAPLPWVATADVADAIERTIAAEVPGWFVLPGPIATGADVARSIGAALGRPVIWQTITPDEFGNLLRPHLGDHAADGTAGVYRVPAAGPAPDPAPARDALGWAPRDIGAWAREAHWPLALAA